MTDFNLSEKIKKTEYTQGSMIFVSDIKEFIRLLKEEYDKMRANENPSDQYFPDRIDKLAGEKLI